MNRYAKGRRLEYRTMRHLEGLGFVCARSAGSHGPWDVVGVRGDEVVFVQVKSGRAKDDGKLAALAWPRGRARRLVYLWPDRAKEPTVVDLDEPIAA